MINFMGYCLRESGIQMVNDWLVVIASTDDFKQFWQSGPHSDSSDTISHAVHSLLLACISSVSLESTEHQGSVHLYSSLRPSRGQWLIVWGLSNYCICMDLPQHRGTMLCISIQTCDKQQPKLPLCKGQKPQLSKHCFLPAWSWLDNILMHKPLFPFCASFHSIHVFIYSYYLLRFSRGIVPIQGGSVWERDTRERGEEKLRRAKKRIKKKKKKRNIREWDERIWDYVSNRWVLRWEPAEVCELISQLLKALLVILPQVWKLFRKLDNGGRFIPVSDKIILVAGQDVGFALPYRDGRRVWVCQ